MGDVTLDGLAPRLGLGRRKYVLVTGLHSVRYRTWLRSSTVALRQASMAESVVLPPVIGQGSRLCQRKSRYAKFRAFTFNQHARNVQRRWSWCIRTSSRAISASGIRLGSVRAAGIPKAGLTVGTASRPTTGKAPAISPVMVAAAVVGTTAATDAIDKATLIATATPATPQWPARHVGRFVGLS
jgi:hypothetical protein